MLENPLFMGSLALLIFGLQLLLCLYAKHLIPKLIPSILFVSLAVLFFVLAMMTEGWGVLFYLVFFILAGFAVALDALAWIVWLIVWAVRRKKRKTDKNQQSS